MAGILPCTFLSSLFLISLHPAPALLSPPLFLFKPGVRGHGFNPENSGQFIFQRKTWALIHPQQGLLSRRIRACHSTFSFFPPKRETLPEHKRRRESYLLGEFNYYHWLLSSLAVASLPHCFQRRGTWNSSSYPGWWRHSHTGAQWEVSKWPPTQLQGL